MIHHLARALFVRSNTSSAAARANGPLFAQPSPDGSRRLVRPHPITPWGRRPDESQPTSQAPNHAPSPPAPQARQASLDAWGSVRISSDPSDARRTVITGRFAEVCAALDRMVMEQEALA